MARNTRTYSDLDFNFTAHPVTKDVSRRFDENAVKTSLKNLILTRNYERPFHSEIGSPIRALMFEPASPMLNITLKRAIIDVINNFEPRIDLTEVSVISSPDNNAVYITVYFKLLNTQQPLSLDLTLDRTR
jgi:phage baseplate assembly protein W